MSRITLAPREGWARNCTANARLVGSGGGSWGRDNLRQRPVQAGPLRVVRGMIGRYNTLQDHGPSVQGHLVFGYGSAPQEENGYRVLSHVEPCFPGTLDMRQNPVLRWSTMRAQPQPLIEVFAEIPDFRRCRGKRHPLPAILSLACCAMLCGSRSYSAIAEWGRNYGARIAHALGFTHNTPCAATLHTVFRHVDRDAVEAKLGAWADEVVVRTPVAPAVGEAAIALDGKTLRGSRKQGAPGVHLLSALAHH